MTEEQEKNERRKRVIPPGDPFVLDSSRITRIRKYRLDGMKKRDRWSEDRRYSQRLRLHRRRYTIIGFAFAALALVLYFGVQLTAPSLYVHMVDGSGTVFIDGEEKGRTEQSLQLIPVGKHVIKVKPDSKSWIVRPESLRVNLHYSWKQTVVTFQAIPDTVTLQQ